MIIAHRGASSIAPENTIAAVKKAFELNADGIEIDVQMSKDGELFVFHDWTLERIAGDKSLISDKKSVDIKKVDAGKWFSEKYIGEKIPLLKELLAAVPAGKLINIEIKKTAVDERDIESKVVKCVSDAGWLDNVIFSSFNHTCIAKVDKIDSKLKKALITYSVSPEPMDYFKSFNCYSIHPVYYYTNQKLINLLHSNKIKIYPWVVDEPKYAKMLTDMGCDGIITNNPAIKF